MTVSLYCHVIYKLKTAYEMRISDWSSDVCTSGLSPFHAGGERVPGGQDSRFSMIGSRSAPVSTAARAAIQPSLKAASSLSAAFSEYVFQAFARTSCRFRLRSWTVWYSGFQIPASL